MATSGKKHVSQNNGKQSKRSHNQSKIVPKNKNFKKVTTKFKKPMKGDNGTENRVNFGSPGTTFVANKKSKKAKSKQKKNEKKGKKHNSGGASDNVKKSNVYDNLSDDIVVDSENDTDDEIIQISSASESEKSDSDGEDVKFIDDNDSDNEEMDEITSETAGKINGEIVNLDSGDDEPPKKKQKVDSLSNDEKPAAKSSMSDDFIGFDFSSDEEEEDEEIQDDSIGSESDNNEYLSNDEGSYHAKNLNHKAGKVNDEFPWIKNSDHSREREMSDWLTSEIKDFIKYISPSKEEIESRNRVIENLRQHIRSIWPDAELHCFGSFATDLYLPGSDIDCVVISKRAKYDNKSALYQLTSYIRNHKLGVEVTPIAKAKVPIIKFVDPKTRIHIDISFERSNGLTAANLIIQWLKTTPGLRELVLVVKQFLAARKLNEVHIGGLGGFSIIILVYAFLKLHPRLSTNNIDPMENLGCLLIEFFELYGYNFGYDDVAIAFTNEKEPIYIRKTSNPDLLGRSPFLLAIQDPYDSANNISRGSFNLRDIKRSFGGAFELLVNKCYELQSASYKERLGKSILGGIIKYKGKERDFEDARDDVKNVAFHAASNNEHMNINKKKSGILLPPLPSEKAGLSIDDYHMSDSYYTDYDSDDTSKKAVQTKSVDQYQEMFNSSQKKTNKSSNQPKQAELLGINDDDENESENDDGGKGDNKYTPSLAANKEPDFSESESDDDYDPAKPVSAAAAVAKENRREYWAQKGKSF